MRPPQLAAARQPASLGGPPREDGKGLGRHGDRGRSVPNDGVIETVTAPTVDEDVSDATSPPVSQRRECASRAAPSFREATGDAEEMASEPALLLVLEADDAEVELAAGGVSCKRCGGLLGSRVRPDLRPSANFMGHLLASPSGGRCAAAGSRRSASSRSQFAVLRAVTRTAIGVGHRRIAVDAGVPAPPCGTGSAARSRAEELRFRSSLTTHALGASAGQSHRTLRRRLTPVEAIGLAVSAFMRGGTVQDSLAQGAVGAMPMHRTPEPGTQFRRANRR